jgi:hypothetical protein
MKLNTARVRDVLENAERYYAAYHAAETFGGPSLYFHQRALETRHAPASLHHLEYAYATLAAWGMHRMGSGGSKMCAFGDFKASVERLNDRILRAQSLNPAMMTEEGWATLKEIFTGLKVMASRTLLVGNSKVMHHMLPNVVPPIDREYTLRYLCGNTMFANDPEKEWLTMRSLISGFFIPVATDEAFVAKARQWIAAKPPWDTSVMKVIDNLLIGARKTTAP